MNHLNSVFNRIGLLDLIFIVPMFMLFSYLPSYNVWSVLLNIVIVIFFAFGLAMAFHIIVDSIKKKKSH
ncbi:DUF6007 family protein [Virgibacillus sp. AGTR]|uniref:DUF6007 family protein n=1 Tax=Virgibacillus sp. AGTR TaxID=2812055 RepID=UPI00047EC735|nr:MULTISPECIES: DUF6007 family protein [Bacillaceae]MCC2252239.1 DUF6007 family protein [Virgibacillus sp. AGTR]